MLSFAGMVTIAKFVIKIIHLYPMMNYALPKACLSEIQKIQIGIIWADPEDKKHVHTVSWDNNSAKKS